MSSTYSKLVKDATKPKPGAPKPKYIDPILASTFSQDGSLADVCRALSLRARESNSTIVFKTLLIIHTMIRNGAVDNVLSHLAADQAGLKLKNVSQGGNWQGEKWLESELRSGDIAASTPRWSRTLPAQSEDSPPSLAPYAAYLDERVRMFRELKHDVIRSAEGATRSRGGGAPDHRLRKLKVEKGLLREVALSQRVMSRSLDCAFFQDNLGDDLNISAFRMVLKDILALYTAINEGVINILEHYFEMSKPDATKALDVYKRFCRHTEKVVAYLGAARKASHSLNMSVPQLKHAPVSLAGALEEYLNDPQFEKNRREYKENKRIADGLPPSESSELAETKSKEPPKSQPSTAASASTSAAPEEKPKPVQPRPPTNNEDVQDFFASLEPSQPQQQQQQQQQQQMMMGGQQFQQNPYSMMPQATGMAWFSQPDMGMSAQATGYNPFLGPQMTGFGGMGSPHMNSQQTGAFGGFNNGFLQAQNTAMPMPMQSQMTGFNPFRQSMMMPQATGAGGQGQQSMGPQMTGMGPMGAFDATPYSVQVQQQLEKQRLEKEQKEKERIEKGEPASSSSTPAPPPATSPPPAKPAFIKPQQTGSRNPFAPPPGERPPTPPTPKPQGPSLAQLALGGGSDGPTQGGGGNYGLGAGAWQPQTSQSQSVSSPTASTGLKPQATGVLGSVASEFTSAGRGNAPSPHPQSPLPTGIQGSQQNGLGNQFSNLSVGGSSSGVTSPSALGSQATGFAFGNGGQSSFASPSLSAQPTGFGGSSVKPFKPESSFGAELAAQHTGMPPQQQQPQQTASANPFGMPPTQQQQQQQPQATGIGNSFSQSSQPPSSSQQQQPQTTGFGSSLFSQQTGQPMQSQATAQPWNNSGNNAGGSRFGGSSVKPFQPQSSFGVEAYGGGQQQPPASQQQQQQQQQQQPNLLQF